MVTGDYTIDATVRDEKINAPAVRKTGNTPAVVYGKETQSIAVQVDAKILRKLYHEAGESSLIQLKLDDEERLILFKGPQYDPRTDAIIHMDFYQIKLGENIKTEVQLVFEGEPPAVEQEDGVLITNKDKVEIECLPRNLPKEIKVDISGLVNIDDSIAVKDLRVPEGVEILDDPEDSVVVVTPPREEEEVPVVSEEDAVEGVAVEGAEGKEEGVPVEGEAPATEGGKDIAESKAGQPSADKSDTKDKEK